MDLPADRLLSLVYWWAVKDFQEQNDLDKFEEQLWRPPAIGVVVTQGPWSAEEETASFAALAREIKGGDVRAQIDD